MRPFGSLGCVELLVILAVLLLVIYPVARILRRTGHSPWLAVAVIIPLGNLALLWYVAFSRWPHVEQNP